MGNYFKAFGILVFVICPVLMAALWQGLHSFLFAWVLNFMLMTGTLFITRTFKPRLASSYYDPKRWEARGKIYKWLGVHQFRKLLVWTGWERLNKGSGPVKKRLDALEHLEYSTRQSEFGHSIIFVIVFTFSLFVASSYGIRHSLWLFSLNLFLNIYPIGVQRYNRPRLQQAIKNLSLATRQKLLPR
jgi:hypothetical protein